MPPEFKINKKNNFAKSTWWLAGLCLRPGLLSMASIWSLLKLEMPIALTKPASTSFSIAFKINHKLVLAQHILIWLSASPRDYHCVSAISHLYYLPSVQELAVVRNNLPILIQRKKIISWLQWPKHVFKTVLNLDCIVQSDNKHYYITEILEKVNCIVRTGQKFPDLGPHWEMHEVKIQVVQLQVLESLLTSCSHQRWKVKSAP